MLSLVRASCHAWHPTCKSRIGLRRPALWKRAVQAADRGQAPMRHFTDSTGVEWTVFEVKRGDTQQRWSYLPHEYGDGWLCFESKLGKRRLTRVPKGWREADEDELETMLRQATKAGAERPRENEMRD